MTALYDAIGLYLDGAGGQDGPQGHAAVHRRRRHPELAAVQRADRSAQGVGRHRLRDRRARRISRAVGARSRTTRFCRRSPRPPAARRSSPPRSRSSTRCTSKVVAEIRAQYTLGYVVDQRRAPTAPGGRSRSSSTAKDSRDDLRPRPQGLLRPVQEALTRQSRARSRVASCTRAASPASSRPAALAMSHQP